MAFDTSIRAEAVRRNREKSERVRIELLQAAAAALGDVAEEFRPDSDIDIAASGTDAVISLAARLSRSLGREVHVVEPAATSIARRAESEGIEWTLKSSECTNGSMSVRQTGPSKEFGLPWRGFSRLFRTARLRS